MGKQEKLESLSLAQHVEALPKDSEQATKKAWTGYNISQQMLDKMGHAGVKAFIIEAFCVSLKISPFNLKACKWGIRNSYDEIVENDFAGTLYIGRGGANWHYYAVIIYV